MDQLQSSIKKGKWEMKLMTSFIIVLSLLLTIAELLSSQSIILFIVQTVFFTLLAFLILGTYFGRPFRWGLFSALIFTSMFSFYLSGSRMALHKMSDVGLSVYLSVGASLSFLFSALYLAYSPEINSYLKWKKAERKKKQK